MLISKNKEPLEPPLHIYKMTSPVLYPEGPNTPQKEDLEFQQVGLIQPPQAYYQID